MLYPPKVCRQCDKQFVPKPKHPGQVFCTVSCRQAYRNAPSRNPAKTVEAREKLAHAAKGNKRCLGREESAQTRERIAQALTGRKQSLEHIANKVASCRSHAAQYGGMTPATRAHWQRLMARQKGSAHPSWRDGSTSMRSKQSKSPEYLFFRRAVLERDNFTCQYCSARNGNGSTVHLQVHHVQSYAGHPELRFSLDNGITLCRPCHNLTKRGVPRPRQITV